MTHHTYMHRCIELAKIGSSNVAPNPMVGAVLVHEGTIIGEGYHQVYGGPHAEVNCLNSVSPRHRHLISKSSLFVSLEPCAHHGKTPPCADLIISQKVPEVIVGCRDPFHAVAGKGIEKLINAGVKVTQGVMEQECKDLNKRFFTFHTLHRPYVILKWAQTNDRKIGNYGNNRLMITNAFTNRLVHRWRSEEMSILVGTNTAAMDDPQLTNRLWSGNSPIRVVIDADLSLPPSLHLFDGSTKTIVFNLRRHGDEGSTSYYQVTDDVSLVHQLLNGLYQMNITSVLVEGGARLIQSFIDDGSWDEARVITNTSLNIGEGVAAPVLPHQQVSAEQKIGDDIIHTYFPNQ